MTLPLALISPQWQCPENIVAYTTTKAGGVSEGDFVGLNVGAHVGDNLHHVQANRSLLPHSEKITWLEQVHGNRVARLPTQNVQADAAFSTSSLHFCAVMTADCVPILLCDVKGTQVAAVHAGWKGLENHIIENAITAFDNAPGELMAWIGPAICEACYEVDEHLASVFKRYPTAIKQGQTSNKFLLNLPLIAEYQLKELGLSNVTQSHLCTYCREDLFYSHRHATHQHKPNTGRIVSVIGLK